MEEAFVNKDSLTTILLNSLKRQIKNRFGHTISENIGSSSNISLGNTIETISDNLYDSNEFSEFMNTFLHDIQCLLEDIENPNICRNLPHNNFRDSSCSSVSSLNTSSIDFLSSEQFQEIIQLLINGNKIEKLLAIETLCRQPSLEHLIKLTLWTSFENALCVTLSSDIIFLKDATLKLYIKMLTSAEAQVVKESYQSLIKLLLQYLIPNLHKADYLEFTNKFKTVVEVIGILNKFQQNICIHWLRYPQIIIEEITNSTVDMLSFSSKNSDMFPIWVCIACFDKKSKWLENIMFGHVSRSFIICALKKNEHVLKYAIQFCEKFCNSCISVLTSNGDCCLKPDYIAEISHIVCFLSHLLQYSQSRKILNGFTSKETFSLGWLNILNLIMQCACNLSVTACFKCSKLVCDMISNKWNYFWNCGDTHVHSNLVQIIITHLKDINCQITNCYYFSWQCLCETLGDFSAILIFSKVIIDGKNLIGLFLKHCIELSCLNSDLTDMSSIAINLFYSSMRLVEKILTNPNYLIMSSDFIDILNIWLMKVNLYLEQKSFINNSAIVAKHGVNIVMQIEEMKTRVYISLLRKPLGIILCHNNTLFETSLHILLEKILKDIEKMNSVCTCDIFTLSTALNLGLTLKYILSKLIVLKLSSVIWQLNENEVENLETIESMLIKLIPSIFLDLVQTELLLDINVGVTEPLFKYVLLFPDEKRCENYDYNEITKVALNIVSLLTRSVQCCCILQAKFHLSDVLFKNQQHLLKVNDEAVIDQISILQNHILVRIYAFGGPTERVLPSETIEEISATYNWPFFYTYPPPNVYYEDLCIQNEDCQLSDEELQDLDLQNIFCKSIRMNNCLSRNLISELLRKSISGMTVHEDLCTVSPIEKSVLITLNEEINVGICMTKRYAKFLNLISDDELKLDELMKNIKCLLGNGSLQFDIFTATIVLICKGDMDVALLFLKKYSTSIDSTFIWHERIVQASKYNTKFTLLHGTILEQCDFIVQHKLPLVFSAFQVSGVLPSIMFNYWTSQCYWNYLDWTEISHFVLLCLLFGGDFSIFFFISILKHLQAVILKNSNDCDIVSLLKKNIISKYKFTDYLDFIIEIGDEFHNDTLNIVMSSLKKDTISS